MRLLLLPALLAAPLVAQEPEFRAGDPGKLKVKVARVEDSMGGLPSALVTVSVANPTDSWAEPTEFLFKVKGVKGVKTLRAPRVEAPFHGRAGRAVPPGGKLDYVIAVPLEPKHVGKSGAEVVHASFFTGEALEQAPVEVGEIDEATPEQDLQGTVVRYSRVQLKNTSPHVVDVVLRADFKQPRNGDALVRFRLAPHEERRCTVEGPIVSFRGYADMRGSDLKSVELVDWSALRGGDEDPGAELLRAAFEAQARWPDKAFRFEADYEVRIEAWDWSASKRVKIVENGHCVSEGGFAKFQPQGTPSDTSGLGWIVLNEASRHLRHPDFESFLDGGRPVLHTVEDDLTIVGVVHPPDRKDLDRWYWIGDGLIVGEAGYPFAGTRKIYERGKSGGRSVVTGEVERDIQVGPTDWDNTLEVEYREVDGATIPVKVERARRFNPEQNNEYVTVELSDVRVSGGKRTETTPAEVPTGELADAVREAWERGHRYPGLPVDLHGKFRMTNPGNDAVWQGHEELSGTFHIIGFHGLGIADAKIVLDGNLREQTAYELADVVRDRFGMYMGRDFCGRPSFDEQFAGARFEKKGNRIVVHECPIGAIELRGGRLQAVTLGAERTLHWKTVDGTEVVDRAEMNDERIEFRRELVGGLWLPVEIAMHDVFEDWGPEHVVLSELRVTPSTAQ